MSDATVERLIDAAMGTLAFDWEWDNTDIPEVKAARDTLREKFNRVLRRKAALEMEGK